MKQMKTENIKNSLKKILESEYPDEEDIKIGQNRGQLFLRIPQKFSRRLQLTKDDKMKMKIQTIEGKNIITLEVIK